MPETVPDESIRAQKIITYLKGKKTVVYATAYDGLQGWDAYLDCGKRHGANAAAKVVETQEVSRELSRKAWEELQQFKPTKGPERP